MHSDNIWIIMDNRGRCVFGVDPFGFGDLVET